MQNGSVIQTKRRSGQSVWDFRWRDRTSGKAVYRRIVVGTIEQYKTEARLTPILALHLDEIRWRNDFDALVLTKLEQVLVSTHQIIRTARGRTFEDAVVSRVFFDGIYSLLWFDMLCETGNLSDCLIDLLFWPAKLVAPQNSLDFI
jgi:hypothetical protein